MTSFDPFDELSLFRWIYVKCPHTYSCVCAVLKYDLTQSILNELLKNGPSPASFLFIFVFWSKHCNFDNKFMWKNPVYSTGIQICDLQNTILTPITTRPGLRPLLNKLFNNVHTLSRARNTLQEHLLLRWVLSLCP